MTKDEALKMCLEYIETNANGSKFAILIKEALAQPEQEPVALEAVYETIIHWDEGGGKRSRRDLARRIVSLYTTPPQRTWVGLTEDEAFACKGRDYFETYKAIEAKLKEKNSA
jgi:pyruvate/2-oxoglutarate dehydrogenase complex dihydrolipoamide dehydrogenase (E3) component